MFIKIAKERAVMVESDISKVNMSEIPKDFIGVVLASLGQFRNSFSLRESLRLAFSPSLAPSASKEALKSITFH